MDPYQAANLIDHLDLHTHSDNLKNNFQSNIRSNCPKRSIKFSDNTLIDYNRRYINHKLAFNHHQVNYVIPGTLVFDPLLPTSTIKNNLVKIKMDKVAMSKQNGLLTKNSNKHKCKSKNHSILIRKLKPRLKKMIANPKNTNNDVKFSEPENKVFKLNHINTPDCIAGKLPFLPVKLGCLQGHHLNIEACVDSGASNSFTSYNLFKQLEDFREYVIERRAIKVNTGKGVIDAKDAILASIPITLLDAEGALHTFMKKFIVLSQLTDATFLGSDFIFDTNVFEHISIDGLHLINNDSLTLVPMIWKKNNKQIRLLSTENKILGPGHSIILSTMASTIPKNDKLIIGDLSENFDLNNNNFFPKTTSSSNLNLDDDISVLPMITERSKHNRYDILITNNGDKYYEFMENFPVATLFDSEEQLDFFQIYHLSTLDDKNDYKYENESQFSSNLVMNNIDENFDDSSEVCIFQLKHDEYQQNMSDVVVAPDIVGANGLSDCQHQNVNTSNNHFLEGTGSYDSIDISNSQLPLASADVPEHLVGQTLKDINRKISNKTLREVKDKIEKDDYMNQEEKEAALESFKKYGYVSKSASSIIDSNKNVTELKNCSDIPLTEDEIIGKIKLDHLTPDQRQRAEAVFRKHIGAFARFEFDCPINNLNVVCDIELVDDFDPRKTVNSKFYPIPPQVRPQIKQILEKMQRSGIIDDCTEYSPIISTLLIGRKKNLQPRVLLDSRQINLFSKRIPTFLTNTQEIMANFSGKTMITSCDINNAFFSIPLHPKKAALFSFFTPEKARKKFLRCAQGARNSSHFMELLTARLIEPLSDCSSYVDDIYLSTDGKGEEGFQKHLNSMEALLKRVIEANVRLKAEKLNFLHSTVDILGFHWTAGERGTFAIPDFRVQAIRDYPIPKTPKRCHSWISFIGYFRKFIYDFSRLSIPFLNLTKCTPSSYKWTPEIQKSFEDLKDRACNAVKIASPDFNKKFYASSDASLQSSAFCLFQLGENDEVIYLGMSSKIFTTAERNTSSFQREVVSILQGLTSYNFYLRFSNDICIFSDCLSIIWIKSCKAANSLLMRLSLILSTYEAEIRHVRGNSSWICDILSRCISVKDIEKNLPSLTPAQATELVSLLTLPEGYLIDKETLKKYLTMPGLQNPYAKNKAKKTTKCVVSAESFNLPKKGRKKFHPPKTTKWHPWYRNQLQQQRENEIDFRKPAESDICTLANVNENLIPQKGKLDQEALSDSCVDILSTSGVDSELGLTGPNIDPEVYSFLYVIRLIDNTNNHENQHNIDTDNSQIGENFDETFFNNYEHDQLESLRLNTSVIRNGSITLDLIRESQSTDPMINDILSKDPLPNHYFIRKGILLNNKNNIEKIVLAYSLLPVLIHRYHFSYSGGHMPASKVIEHISEMYYHPHLKQIILSTMPNCILCLSQKPHHKKFMVFGKNDPPSFPREKWAFDLVFGYTPVKGYVGLAVFLDLFSLYCVITPIKSKTSEELLFHFKTKIYQMYGVCHLFSDCENSILSQNFRSFCDSHNIITSSTAPRSSWQNGNIECLISMIKIAIRIYTKQENISWVDAIPHVQLCLNKRKLSSKYTPELILYGNELPNMELLQATQDFTDFESYMSYFQNHVNHIREVHMKRRAVLADRTRNCVNRSRHEYHFSEGMLVYLRDFEIQQDTGGSSRSKYLGPFIIENLDLSKNICQLRNLENHKLRMAHLINIKPAVGPINIIHSPANLNPKEILYNHSNQNSKDNNSTLPDQQSDTLRRSTRIKTIPKKLLD